MTDRPQAPPGDLDRFVAEERRDPRFRVAHDDAGTRERLVATLTQRRRDAGLSVEDVTVRAEFSPSAVRVFEGGATDPRLSMLQRYARAVGLRLRMDVGPEVDWSRTSGPLTVAALRDLLEGIPDDALVVLAKVGEGNGFSPLHDWTPDVQYLAESEYSGSITGGEGVRCVVLWPTN